MRILALNAGSRSHNAELYALADAPPLDPPAPLWRKADESSDGTFAALLDAFDGEPPDGVAHRFVHPGPELADEIAFRIGAREREIVERCDLAPSHNPLALEGLAAATKRFPNAVQVGVSDIALGPHAPRVATTYAVPYEWRERYGVRRYGFHGISHRDVLERSAQLASGAEDERRTISIHLGSGCSIVAARGRTIVDSTMGMTPFEGLMMGSRSGTVDPGMLFTLVRRGDLSLDELERAIGKESGLAGVSGLSPDTRDIEKAIAAGDERARFALELFAYVVRKHVGAMSAVLGGLDVLSFTGPVGAHSPTVRKLVCSGLAYLDIALDDERNDAVPTDDSMDADASLEPASSRVRVQVIRTLEEWAMARAARELVR